MKHRRSEKPHKPDSLPNRYSTYTPSHYQLPNRETVDENVIIKKHSLTKRIITSAIIFFFAAVIFLGVWDAKNISAAENKMFGTRNLLRLISPGTDISNNGRINILLIGYSVDDPGHPGAALTDSIILLSMSNSSPTGYMLSIPRDLYVKIPGYGYGKINEAYQDGGIATLEQVVTNCFKVPVNYYALINYSAVRDIVNALGGITVNIESSNPKGLYDPNISPRDGGPLKLSNGLQSLDGQTALNLARARGDAPDSYGFPQADFDRTQHQRQILSAIKAKLSWKLILNPKKNGDILNAIATNIKTDIPVNGARSIFGRFNSIPNQSIQSLSLRSLGGRNYLASYTTTYGQSALIPALGIDDYSAIDEALDTLSQ